MYIHLQCISLIVTVHVPPLSPICTTYPWFFSITLASHSPRPIWLGSSSPSFQTLSTSCFRSLPSNCYTRRMWSCSKTSPTSAWPSRWATSVTWTSKPMPPTPVCCTFGRPIRGWFLQVNSFQDQNKFHFYAKYFRLQKVMKLLTLIV